MSPQFSTSPYVCDTIPSAKLAAGVPSGRDSPPSLMFDLDYAHDDDDDAGIVEDALIGEEEEEEQPTLTVPPQPPQRKLCVRHQRMADEGTILKMQQSLDALPVQDREAVNAVWSNFSSSSHPMRALILQGLLTMCCFSQLSLLSEHLAHLIRIDPFSIFPREVSLKVLTYLDATSLCRAAQVNRQWKVLADDNILWRGICEQHIGQKCKDCGWGLPRLDRLCNIPRSTSPCTVHQSPFAKRALEEQGTLEQVARAAKRQRLESLQPTTPSVASGSRSPLVPPPRSPSRGATNTLENPPDVLFDPESAHRNLVLTRPWKDVYCERLTVERNWRRGRCTVRTLKGHTDGVLCLQVNENLSHPSFPVLITGSYDCTARVWNLETGTVLRVLREHHGAVRALQFDEVKLITASMDSSLRVWDWRSGRLVRTLWGNGEGFLSLNFDSNVLASGSVDCTVRVWNLRTGGAFTLRGHSDWVNSVQLWDSGSSSAAPRPSPSAQDSPSQIDPGKMLLSASDDGTIKLWDLNLRTCVRTFTGHVCQVQSMKLLLLDDCSDDDVAVEDSRTRGPAAAGPLPVSIPLEHPGYHALTSVSAEPPNDAVPERVASPAAAQLKQLKTLLISGSLDNTVKMWDIDTGKTVRTLFGHIEGVWAVAADKLRLVTGSHDRTIKVWNREEGRCTATLVGHCAAVTCLSLGEDKIVSGSDDGDVKTWSFQ